MTYSITFRIYIEVEADSEEEAIKKAQTFISEDPANYLNDDVLIDGD